jgi:hypothetical protein
MRTLLFCTAWGETSNALERRLGRWVRHHAALHYPCDVALGAIADGIPVSVGWPSGDYHQVNFEPHLGRPSHLSYPGWWRSFTYGAALARSIHCQRIWHVESDFFIASHRMIARLDSLRSGWSAFWCHRHGFAETAVQVIGADRFQALDNLRDRIHTFDGQHAEAVLPFDQVIKDMVGDRYGEMGTRPQDVPGLDYYGQLPDGEPAWFETGEPVTSEG